VQLNWAWHFTSVQFISDALYTPFKTKSKKSRPWPWGKYAACPAGGVHFRLHFVAFSSSSFRSPASSFRLLSGRARLRDWLATRRDCRTSSRVIASDSDTGRRRVARCRRSVAPSYLSCAVGADDLSATAHARWRSPSGGTRRRRLAVIPRPPRTDLPTSSQYALPAVVAADDGGYDDDVCQSINLVSYKQAYF